MLLTEFGVPVAQASTLRWRSVAANLILRRSDPGALMHLPDAPVVAELERELLRQLDGITPERFEALMDSRVT